MSLKWPAWVASRRSAKNPRMVAASSDPILRWAGSKRALLRELQAWVPQSFGRYVEPFAGSACLFFSLAPRRAVLADRNRELIDFYRRLRHRPRPIARLVAAMPRDANTYYSVRALGPDTLSPDQRAARFLYLNRMAFNGVYRTNRSGHFNVPMGQRVGAFPPQERIVRCARLLRQAELIAGDFELALSAVRRGDFVYLDPPYSRSAVGNYGVYGYGSFDRRELERLIHALDQIDRCGATFLLSYAADPEVISRLQRYRVGAVAVTAQVGGRRSRRSTRAELLATNAR